MTQSLSNREISIMVIKEMLKEMDRVDNESYKWFLVVKENGKQIVEYSCPNEIVGDMVKILAAFQMGEEIQPSEAIIIQFRNVIESGIIPLEMTSKLTGISEEYLKKLLSGISEPYDTKKIIALTELLEKIK